ncbi:hypothetical protein [Natranaerofaba carboxydovora]|uniref:hypothetical protein n=1 Tax=Natranaerofaba carboxydovora TaxID=2742683 RepID=UPI001F12A416|nr:hypothetical protein [Natranaerofaba carboxydovora]UMZ73019.1 hypothetical protein ACONDI_00563 [Natranaerofaba carboxydovora]
MIVKTGEVNKTYRQVLVDMLSEESNTYAFSTNEKMSLLFGYFIGQATEKNLDSTGSMLSNLVRYMKNNVKLLDSLKIFIAKKNKITEKDLERLEGIEKSKKAVETMDNNFCLGVFCDLDKEIKDQEELERAKEKLTNYALIVDNLIQYKSGLLKVGVDSMFYYEISEEELIECLLEGIVNTVENIKAYIDEITSDYISKGYFREVKNLLILYQLSILFARFFARLTKNQDEVFSINPDEWKNFLKILDFEVDLDLREIPAYEDIDLYHPDYYNL